MKIYPLIILSTLLFSIALTSCTPNNPQPNPPTNYPIAVSWQANLNGVNYSYSDSYSSSFEPTNSQGSNEGQCSYFLPSISLTKGGPFTAGDDVNIYIQRNEIFSVGTYNITTGGSIGMSAMVNTILLGHYSFPNTNVTLNITEVPSAAGGLIKGNFSGVMGTSQSSNCATIPVSGQFQALRTL